jgi:hypothetical protein
MVRSEANRAHRWERAPGQPEGLGTAPLGNLFTEVQEPDADATIDAALGSASPSAASARRLARVPRDRFVLSTSTWC